MAGELSKSVRILVQATDKTGGKLKATSKDLKEIDKQAKKSGKSIDKTSKSAKGLSKSFKGLAGAAAALTAAAVALAFPIAKAANFQRAMAEVGAISGATGEEFKALNERAKDLGRTTEFTATQAAGGLKMLSMAGLDARESIEALKPALDLALVGGIELGDSADYITNIMGGMGLAVEDVAHITDVLAKTATSSNSSVTELAEAMSYAAPAAKAMGVGVDETAAAMGVLHDNGIKGSRAGTAMRAMFSKLATQTPKATAAFKKLGVEVSYNTDGTLNYTKTMEDLGRAGMGLAEANAIFGRYAGTAALAVASQTDKVKKLTKENENSKGSLEEMAKIFNNTAKGAYKNMISAVEGLAIAFGEKLLPILVPIMKAFTATLNAITSVAEAFPITTQAVIAIVAVLGTAATAMYAFNAALVIARASTAALAGTKIASFLIATATGANSAAFGLGTMNLAVNALRLTITRVLPLLAAFTIGWEIGTWLRKFDVVEKAGIAMAAGLHKAFLKAKQAWALVSGGDTAAVKAEIESVSREYQSMFDNVGKEAPKATKAIKKSVDEQVDDTVEATEEMAEAYKAYVDKVNELQDKISGRQKSLTAELREMGRSGMSDLGAWKDRKKEANEYYLASQRAMNEAKKALAAGDQAGADKKFAEAAQYADEAKGAYKDLNEEVKKGDKVIISGSKALKTSMNGVRVAGELAINILNQQKDAAQAAADSLDESTGGLLKPGAVQQEVATVVEEIDKVKGATDEVAIDWGQRWKEMGGNARGEIDSIWQELRKIDGKVVKVYVNQVEKKMAGGMAGIQKFATGGFAKRQGKLAGFGGGDRIKALLEAGEFIINKSAVRKYGAGLFHALNSMNFNPANLLKAQVGGMISNIGSLIPTTALAGAAGSGESISLNLNLPTAGPPISMQADRFNAGEMIAQLEKMGRRSS